MLKLLSRKTPVTKPQAVIPAIEEFDQHQEYVDLCSSIEASQLMASMAPLRKLAAEHRFPVYDLDEVSIYMRSITPKNMLWGWFALNDRAYRINQNFHQRDGDFIDTRYTLPVPIHILRRAKIIHNAYRNVELYVTHYDVPTPDPFIAARYLGELLIFGMWDEPGFANKNTEV